jgi:hypothetical protein
MRRQRCAEGQAVGEKYVSAEAAVSEARPDLADLATKF